MTDTTAMHQETMLTRTETEYVITATRLVLVQQMVPVDNVGKEIETDKNEDLICEANRK